jgi:PII-like signaling protein
MRDLDGDQFLVRIFFGEDDKWHHQPLERALLERLRQEGFAGATVFRGISGFGAASVIHTRNIVGLSGDLPIVVEVVDDKEHVGRLIRILDEMITGGALVTVEEVRVLRYAAKRAPSSGPASEPPSSPRKR